LTDDVLKLLTALQECQREGNPYVFVPTPRYDHIQELRKTGKWTVEKGRCPLNNFTREFNKIRTLAGIDYGEFHDLRRTCLSNWLENGLSEFDVMTLAGHSKFETTRRFYLAIRKDLIDRARVISEQTEEDNLLRAPSKRYKCKRVDKRNCLSALKLHQRGRRGSNPQPSDRQSDIATISP